jgi:hypothetical protein
MLVAGRSSELAIDDYGCALRDPADPSRSRTGEGGADYAKSGEA